MKNQGILTKLENLEKEIQEVKKSLFKEINTNLTTDIE